MKNVLLALTEVNKRIVEGTNALSYIYLEVEEDKFTVTSTDACLLLSVSFEIDKIENFVYEYELLTGATIPRNEDNKIDSCMLLVDNKKRLKLATKFVNSVDIAKYPNYKAVIPSDTTPPATPSYVSFTLLKTIEKIGKQLGYKWETFKPDYQLNNKMPMVKMLDLNCIKATLLVMPLRP